MTHAQLIAEARRLITANHKAQAAVRAAYGLTDSK